MVSPEETIHLGFKVSKYKIPQELIDRLNKDVDDNLKSNNLLPEVEKLAGEIKEEWSVLKILPKELKIFFEECLNNYVSKEVPSLLNKKCAASFNACWINDQIQNEYNPVHTHNGKSAVGLSSVLFLRVPKSITEAKQTINKNERVKDGRLEFIANTHSYMGANQYLVTPEVGDLYLFPYELPHVVYPFKGEGVRRSLSFNVDIGVANNG
tara:strand:+ start:5388 stop:6017 length:630 start_codon:yes stop_codon:yes gene_type:complete